MSKKFKKCFNNLNILNALYIFENSFNLIRFFSLFLDENVSGSNNKNENRRTKFENEQPKLAHKVSYALNIIFLVCLNRISSCRNRIPAMRSNTIITVFTAHSHDKLLAFCITTGHYNFQAAAEKEWPPL